MHEVGKPLGLDEESLRTHPMRHVLTMAIGVGSTLTIKYYMVSLQPGAHAAAFERRPAWRDQTESDRADPARPGRASEQKCRRLIEAARTAGGPDNISCVLIRAVAP